MNVLHDGKHSLFAGRQVLLHHWPPERQSGPDAQSHSRVYIFDRGDAFLDDSLNLGFKSVLDAIDQKARALSADDTDTIDGIEEPAGATDKRIVREASCNDLNRADQMS